MKTSGYCVNYNCLFLGEAILYSYPRVIRGSFTHKKLHLLSCLQLTGVLNPLNVELNPICHLLALLGAHHIFHVSGLKVKLQKDQRVNETRSSQL